MDIVLLQQTLDLSDWNEKPYVESLLSGLPLVLGKTEAGAKIISVSGNSDTVLMPVSQQEKT